VDCATQRGKRNPISAPKAPGPNGLSREAAAYEARWAVMRQVGLAGLNPGEISNGNTYFKFQLNSDFWQHFGEFYKEV
jgi:hypothetical protein